MIFLGVDATDPVYLEASMKALELARSTGELPQMSPVAMPNPGNPYTLPPTANPAAVAAAASAAMTAEARLKVSNILVVPFHQKTFHIALADQAINIK